jgi:NADH:ubiquinone oxidoreductase subunit 5 (subunit L)/multisubunit Na+/H+ antiporter MnhA subunit
MHGLAKALAFLGADRVETAARTDHLQPLGGLAALLPRTATGFGLAVVTLAALPPFGGFVSEWLTLMALLQAFRVPSTVAQLVLALGGAVLALTAGIALLAFAKLFGGAFLGRSRSALGALREPAGIGLGFAVLSFGALVLGPIAPWEIRWLGNGLEGLLGFDLARDAITFPLVLGPVYQGFSVLSPTFLALGITAFLLAAAILVHLLFRPPVRRAPVWVSGSAPPIASVQYTPDGYANPIRVVLAGLYGFKRTVHVQQTSDGRETAVARTRMVPAFEEYLYRPVAEGTLWLSGRARRFQSGHLGSYLLYILIVLLAVLALIPALKS